MFYHILVLLFAVVMLMTQKSHAIPNASDIDSRKMPEIVRLLTFKYNSKKELIEDGPCSGVAISDFLVLTAGHCVTGKNNEQMDVLALHRFKKDGKEEIIPIDRKNMYTEYIAEDLEKMMKDLNKGAKVDGCVPRKKPILQTKTPDLALLRFPRGTFKKTSQVSFSHVFKVSDSLEYYGYGSKVDTYVVSYPGLDPQINDLRKGSNTVWRTSEKRVAFTNPDSLPFADLGDSGGPVYFNKEVVAILSTKEIKCETEYGSDYGITNTATNLSSLESLNFFTRAVEALTK